MKIHFRKFVLQAEKAEEKESSLNQATSLAFGCASSVSHFDLDTLPQK